MLKINKKSRYTFARVSISGVCAFLEIDGGILLINFVDDYNNREMICHKNSILLYRYPKIKYYSDLLHELIRNSSRKLIHFAIEAEIKIILKVHDERRLYRQACQCLVHNDYLLQQTMQLLLAMLRLKCLRSEIAAKTEYTSITRMATSFIYLKRAKSAKSYYLVWIVVRHIHW